MNLKILLLQEHSLNHMVLQVYVSDGVMQVRKCTSILNKVKGPFNTTFFSQEIAIAALKGSRSY